MWKCINSLLVLVQVVRCFDDNDIVHVNGNVDPKSDIDVINLELVFSDLDQVCYIELEDLLLQHFHSIFVFKYLFVMVLYRQQNANWYEMLEAC